MTNYVNINPGPISEQSPTEKEFSALVKVKSSRYAEHAYQEGSGIPSKIGIKWTMETTKGNTFERSWPTGHDWETHKDKISPDGKKISIAPNKNSDATYFLQKIINESGFPSSKLTDDISVFEGETFYIATDKNPRAQGSARKPYPKKYHPEGWEKAKAEQLARREASESAYQARQSLGGPATLSNTYAPPAVVVQPNVRKAGAEALEAILRKSSGGKVDRAAILQGLNEYLDPALTKNAPTWPPSFRQEVTLALWDYAQATAVVGTNPNLNIEGGPTGFTVSLSGGN